MGRVDEAHGATMQAPADTLSRAAAHGLGVIRRVARSTPLRLGAFAAVALIATWPLLSSAGSLNDYRDSHPLVHYEESARRTVTEFGEWPLWDPYYCGGLDLLGTPQSRFVSPTFVLTLIFGTLRAEPISAWLLMLIGLEGAFRYARSRRSTSLGAMLGAPVFALSGFFAVAPALGWYNFMGFELVPWAIWGVRRAARGHPVGVAVAAIALAWIVGFGGTYPAPMAALWCAFESAEAIIVFRKQRRRLAIAAALLALTAILALLLAAVRLLPIMQTLEMAPRIIGGTPGRGWRSILKALVWRIRPDENGDFSIGGNFRVGVFVLVPIVAGVINRRAWPLVLVGVLLLWLASGYMAHPSLFAWLKELPVYETLRYPERFLVLFALAVSAVAAIGISRLQVWARKQATGRIALSIGVIFALANLAPLLINHHAAANGRPMVAPPAAIPGEFKQARGTRWGLAHYGPMNRGCLSCYDAYPVPQSPLLRGDLAAEEYLVDPSAGKVERKAWSPNRITLAVTLEKDAKLLVNQNWHPGWRASVGEVSSERGLLAVALPKGTHELVLTFRPRAAVAGGMGSLAALVAAIAILWLARQKRLDTTPRGLGKLAGLALFPALPLGIAYASVDEPPLPPKTLLTPDGDAIVTDAPPEGSMPMGVVFASGITLEAVRVAPQAVAPGAMVRIELDWRTRPDVEKRTGIFLHVVPDQGEPDDELRADHVYLSGQIEIEKAPSDRLLRDVVQLTAPHKAKGKHYVVWGGVWRVSRGGSRVEIQDKGAAHVDKDGRVRIGEFWVK